MCHLPKAFVYIMWSSIDTWRSAVHLAEVTRFPCVNSEGITNAWQGERFENLFPLKHSPANLCNSRFVHSACVGGDYLVSILMEWSLALCCNIGGLLVPLY